MNIFESLAPKLTAAMVQLLESLNAYATAPRRDFITSAKVFLTCEFRHRFVGVIPSLTNETFILGDSFSSQEFLRNYVYSVLADMLHHVRMNLSYPVLVQ